jgi:hypothetical protein
MPVHEEIITNCELIITNCGNHKLYIHEFLLGENG